MILRSQVLKVANLDEISEDDLRYEIIKSLPKMSVNLDTSVGDLLEANKLLVHYFIQKELKKSELTQDLNSSEQNSVKQASVQTEPPSYEQLPPIVVGAGDKTRNRKSGGVNIMKVTACKHSNRKHYAKVSQLLT
jgi:hypothetical protein